MTRAELRAALSGAGAFPLIWSVAEAGELPLVLRTELSEHIGAVYRRLEAALDEDFALASALRLAVLVHEEPPGRLPALLTDAGLADLSATVAAVVGAFGRIWKLRNERDAVDYAMSHRSCLEPLLLFELAHEGTSTPAMNWVAAFGGLEAMVDRWAWRLASRALTSDLSGRP